MLIPIILQLAGLFTFLYGFFPTKVVLSGQNDQVTSPNGPQFDKVVVMVVDAMRADFMFSERSEMHFLHSLVREGKAIPYTAHASPPTVTLPRLKGITTGGTASFLDAILNVADEHDQSQGLGMQDSWVQQFANKGKRMRFFGDDTWLKLFPSVFEQSDGTSSFFVSDFTEVDHNVTRHLDTQLGSDWDALILHYLGLDHIGHKGGPNSVFMAPKQREMDHVLKRVYTSMDKNTLLVLLGDHGMNEVGNHGGSSPGETSPGLALISMRFKGGRPCPLPWKDDYNYYRRVSQIDMVPTLAALLDFPIPKNSLGVVLNETLAMWKEPQKVLRANLQQLMGLYKGDIEMVQGVEEMYNVLYHIQGVLASAATEYGYREMGVGILLLFTAAVASIVGVREKTNTEKKDSENTTEETKNTKQAKSAWMNSNVTSFLIITCIYAVHFFGSSLIEEEHQIWWFLSMSLLVLSLPKTMLLAPLLRIIRAWNNTGQKHMSATLGQFLLSHPGILWVLIGVVYAALCAAIVFSGRSSSKAASMSGFVVVFMACATSASFKLLQYATDGNKVPGWLQPLLDWIVASFGADLTDKKSMQAVVVSTSQISVFFVLALAVNKLVQRAGEEEREERKETRKEESEARGKKAQTKLHKDNEKRSNFLSTPPLLHIITLYLVHQTRFENIPMFLVFEAAKYVFSKSLSSCDSHKVLMVTLFTLCMQNISFFSMGGTNSLATVDLSNAYNGVTRYSVFVVGVQTFVSNFSGPLYWSLASLPMLSENGRVQRRLVFARARLLLTFYSIAALVLVTACVALRFHLFIWTVFSPKLLFFVAWSVLVNMCVDVGIASLATI